MSEGGDIAAGELSAPPAVITAGLMETYVVTQVMMKIMIMIMMIMIIMIIITIIITIMIIITSPRDTTC